MKKLIVILVLVMMSTGLYAQQAGQSTLGFRIGIARGMVSGLSGNESNVSTLNPVVYYAYTFMDNFSLQLEISTAVRAGIDYEWWWGTGEWRYTSIDIPVLLRYNFFHGLLGFMAGPHISIPVGYDYINGGDSPSMTFGVTAALQGLFPLGGVRFVGDLRFITDFNNIVSDLRRQALAVTAGFEFSF
ncbi:MAG: hypothetical protein FWB99_08365 [Treponema sp.]|nr:hypothetical protein [Treponema sp.]